LDERGPLFVERWSGLIQWFIVWRTHSDQTLGERGLSV